jgi:hypothetical protein
MDKKKIAAYYKAEIENIDNVVKLLKNKKNKKLNSFELAGLGVYLHNFYNGLENIIKRVLEFKKIKVKESPFWHKELLLEAVKQNIIDDELHNYLLNYLTFRHYFIHGYAFKLEYLKLKNLMKDIDLVYSKFKKDVESSININS